MIKTIFQFLMVRLKGKSRMAKGYENLISIPYGAIKRYNKNRILLYHNAFQFLMVRLKACLFFQATDTFRKFQFLMVRLKGGWKRWN